MDHIEPDELAVLALDGREPDDAARAHLAECAECRAEYDALARTAALGRAGVPEGELEAPPASVWAGILAGEFPPNGGNWTYNTNQEFFDLTAEAQQLAGEASCDAWTAAQASAIGNLEVMPFAESTSTLYGAGVEFDVTTNGLLIPTSLRG